MIQQVNLYQLEKKQKQPNVVLLDRNIQILLAALGLLLILSIYLFIDLNNTESDLNQAKTELSDSESQLQSIKEQYPKQEVDPLLTAEISRLETILKGLSQAHSLLSDTESDKSRGFSSYLTALANQSLSSIWLTALAINTEENDFSIVGSTYTPNSIPEYLKKLHQEPIFKGKHFAKLAIEQKEQDQKLIQFNITTRSQKNSESKQEEPNE